MATRDSPGYAVDQLAFCVLAIILLALAKLARSRCAGDSENKTQARFRGSVPKSTALLAFALAAPVRPLAKFQPSFFPDIDSRLLVLLFPIFVGTTCVIGRGWRGAGPTAHWWCGEVLQRSQPRTSTCGLSAKIGNSSTSCRFSLTACVRFPKPTSDL